jgi:hypothetical protein
MKTQVSSLIQVTSVENPSETPGHDDRLSRPGISMQLASFGANCKGRRRRDNRSDNTKPSPFIITSPILLRSQILSNDKAAPSQKSFSSEVKQLNENTSQFK